VTSVRKPSLVYVIGSDRLGYVKIGHSANPEARLADLQVGNPLPLRILAVLGGGRELEKLLHDNFATHRVVGEWFDFGGVDPALAVASAAALLGYPTLPGEHVPEVDYARARAQARPGPRRKTPAEQALQSVDQGVGIEEAALGWFVDPSEVRTALVERDHIRAIAMEMRRCGASYGQISKATGSTKGSLHSFLRRVPIPVVSGHPLRTAP
jgi:hypothetical protein